MDPANAVFACGAECGIAVIGTLSAGTEHWAAISGTPTVVTSGPSPMRSTRCFRFNSTAATVGLQHTLATAIASPATAVARFYVYFATLPSADCEIFRMVSTAVVGGGVKFEASDNTLRAWVQNLSTQGASGAVVTTGVWYRVDVKVVRAGTGTCDIQVDGVAQAQATTGVGAAAINDIALGHVSDSVTADFYIDDVIVSGTSGDYPIGAGTCKGLYPVSDRTNSAANPTDGNSGHLYSATGDFNDTTGTALAAQNVEADTWQSLANPLSTSIGSNFVRNLLGASTEHLVWELDNLPGNAASINGAMVVCTTHSASATTNEFRLGLAMSGFLQTVIGPLDLSETTITVPVSVRAQPPTGSWSVDAANGLQAWFGNSADVNPDPYLDGCCVEVDYVEAPPMPARASPYPQMIGR